MVPAGGVSGVKLAPCKPGNKHAPMTRIFGHEAGTLDPAARARLTDGLLGAKLPPCRPVRPRARRMARLAGREPGTLDPAALGLRGRDRGLAHLTDGLLGVKLEPYVHTLSAGLLPDCPLLSLPRASAAASAASSADAFAAARRASRSRAAAPESQRHKSGPTAGLMFRLHASAPKENGQRPI